MIRLKDVSMLCLLSVLGWGSACRTASYTVVAVQGGRVEMTAAYDEMPDAEALSVLAPYKAKVDSVMSPVIGESAMSMAAGRPESLLSNLVADVLREASEAYPEWKAEVGLVNVGGLRTSLPEGDVTYGDIYRILPFENSLCIVTLTGTQLKRLFENIAAAGGEGLSGARLVISADRKLLACEVGGKPVEEGRTYRVSTIDYLAEGNDGMSALTGAAARFQPEGATLRQLFLDYVARMHRAGKKVSACMEERITVK